MCIYCDKDSKVIYGKDYTVFGEKFGTAAYIAPEMCKLKVEIGGDCTLSKKIRYCPFCGRRLKKEEGC